MNRKLLAALIKRSGIHGCETAENGQLAIDTILRDKSRFKIVFMDNLMPVLDGVEATKILRKQGFTNLIIGVTGNVLADDVLEFMKAGADLIMSKPLQITHLKMVLQFACEQGYESRSTKQLEAKGNKFVWVDRDF